MKRENLGKSTSSDLPFGNVASLTLAAPSIPFQETRTSASL